MFVSLNWLRDFVDLPKNLDSEELGKLLTVRSAEVETVVDQGKALDKVVVGKVLELKKHPNADKLTLAITDIGKKKVQIVCGGNNLKEGFLGAIALPGAVVKWHGEEVVEMAEAKVRGETSHGMICTPIEIGLEALEDDRELLDLTETKAKPGTPVAKLLGLDDTIIEFDNKTLTHRPDLWGHIGIAREISAITGSPFGIPKPKVALGTDDKPNIDVENPELCPRYMGLIIRGIKVEQSPDWLKKRLLATDHSLYTNIVDVTNYVLEEVGQPMHAFDLRMIEKGIIVRTAKKGEKITTLDGEEKSLDENMLLIADHKKPIAVAGVMGGEYSGIQEDTVDILLESANFDATSVRQTSTKLGLRTDAVQRFEKSLDPNQCEHALLRAAELILKICPDAKVGAIADVSNFEDSEPLITVDVDRVQRKIGVRIPAPEMADYLARLHFNIQGKVDETSQQITLTVPSFRATKDVDIEDDIVEEVARMYGYENIPAVAPVLPTKAPSFNKERRHKHDAREIFAHALGYTETYNYSFYGPAEITTYGLDEKSHLKLLNTLSEEQSHLRKILIPNLIKALGEATKYEANPALFEIGRTYEEDGEFMPKEEKRIAAVRAFGKDETDLFSHTKGDLEQFLDQFGISGSLEFVANENPPSYMHPHQNAEVRLRGKTIGNIFTLHPYIAEKIACFELDFAAISQARQSNQTYKAESKFPSVEFDISVLLDKRTSAAEIESAIKKSLGKLAKQIELFDSYEGDRIDPDKKSLAYRITLQADDRTLTNEDLEKAQKDSWAALEKLGGIVRK
jgi:phenylalanyl-tRNA synthetase beta chain